MLSLVSKSLLVKPCTCVMLLSWILKYLFVLFIYELLQTPCFCGIASDLLPANTGILINVVVCDFHQYRKGEIYIYIHIYICFPGSSAGKESTCNAGNPGLLPGWWRSSGEGIGHPLQYSWASLVAQWRIRLQCGRPGFERSHGGGHGNQLQYSCLENPHGQRCLMGYSP